MPRKSTAGPTITITCVTCGHPFETNEWRYRRRGIRYCSRDCAYANSAKRQPQTCAQCGVEFYADKPRKYCSVACRSASQRRSGPRACQHCGETFYPKPSYVAKGAGIYCSQACKAAAQTTRVTRNCKNCGTPFTIKAGEATRGGYYCSIQCYAAHRRNENRRDRYSWRYRAWRKQVLARDGHRCQSCGATDGLHVHHIEQWTKSPGQRLDPANGVTLCKDCHAQAHALRGESAVAAWIDSSLF